MNNLVLSFTKTDLDENPEARKVVDSIHCGDRSFDLLGLTYIPTKWFQERSSFEETVTTIHAVIARKVNIPGERINEYI